MADISTTSGGNINAAVSTVSSSISSVLSSGTGLITWGKGIFGKYAMWILGLIGLMFISRIFKIKL